MCGNHAHRGQHLGKGLFLSDTILQDPLCKLGSSGHLLKDFFA